MAPKKRKAEEEAEPTRSSTKGGDVKSVKPPPPPAKKEEDAKPKLNESEVNAEKTIVIERCTQCNAFKTRAEQVRDSLESLPGIAVTINPVKPRRGCFEIREEGGGKFISLLDMKRPFKPMKDLNMQEVIDNTIRDTVAVSLPSRKCADLHQKQ